MKVKDVMHADKVKSCTAETKLSNSARLMKDINVGALPVVDDDDKVIGIVTDRDICLSLAKKNGTHEPLVKELLTSTKVRTVKTEDPVEKALREMRRNKVGRLPVTDEEGKLTGMLSVNNLLSRALKKKKKLGKTKSKKENLAKTITALFDRNSHPLKRKKSKVA